MAILFLWMDEGISLTTPKPSFYIPGSNWLFGHAGTPFRMVRHANNRSLQRPLMIRTISPTEAISAVKDIEMLVYNNTELLSKGKESDVPTRHK